MNQNEPSHTLLQSIKENGTTLLNNAGGFLTNAIEIFRKEESQMSVEEKIEKQHLLNFLYGVGTGIIIYHFLIGALLILGMLWLYGLSLKKTKGLIEEVKPKKRTYKRRKSVSTKTSSTE